MQDKTECTQALYKELAQAALTIKIENNITLKRIYLVDDAWHWPRKWIAEYYNVKDEKDEKKIYCGDEGLTEKEFPAGAVFSELPKEIIIGKEQDIDTSTTAQPATRSGSRGDEVQVTKTHAEPDEENDLRKLIKAINSNSNDAAVAKRMIKFAQKNGYNLVFCSFEYLFENWNNEINKPSSAIFFDLRHQLFNAFETCIERADYPLVQAINTLESDATDGQVWDSNRVGWHMHFGLKIGLFKDKQMTQCRIFADHLQILSSAINPKPSQVEDKTTKPRQAAVGEFLEVRRQILRIKDKVFRPRDLMWSPSDKQTFESKDDEMESALNIFNNSFSRCDWPKLREDLFKDIKAIYDIDKKGHLSENPQINFNWDCWFPSWDGELKNLCDALFQGESESDNGCKLLFLKSFFQTAGFCGIDYSSEDLDLQNNFYPNFKPFIFLLVALAEFAYELTPKAGQYPPEISIQNKSNGEKTNTISIDFKISGLDSLLIKANDEGKKTGAAGAYSRLKEILTTQQAQDSHGFAGKFKRSTGPYPSEAEKNTVTIELGSV